MAAAKNPHRTRAVASDRNSSDADGNLPERPDDRLEEQEVGEQP